ncbi:MAG: glycosyltransferase [Thermocladium sp.]
MPSIIAVIFILLAILGVLASTASLVREVTYWRSARLTGNGAEPDVTIVIPMRGLDADLEDNLTRIVNQRYSGRINYIIAVDSLSDPALPIASRIIPNPNIVVQDPGSASGKGSALSRALREVKTDIVIICDSDIKPHEEWLRRLVSHVDSLTASTTYRWYIGRGAAGLLMANFSSLGLTGMQSDASRFTWGGSTALPMSFVLRSGVMDLLPLYLSDDYLITRKLHEAGMKIIFEPGAMVLSLAEENLRSAFTWSVRQMWYVKVYGTKAFHASLASYTIMSLASFIPLLLPMIGWFSLLPLLIFPMGVIKEYVRASAIARLNPSHKPYIRPGLHALFSIPNLYFTLIVLYTTLITKEITWRGRRYRESDALRMIRK